MSKASDLLGVKKKKKGSYVNVAAETKVGEQLPLNITERYHCYNILVEFT